LIYSALYYIIDIIKGTEDMEMKRYYMTTESADDELYEHRGNIRGARTIAQRLANERNETVYINSVETEDIVDCVFPD